MAELVEESARDDLAGEASGGECKRRVKRFYDNPVRGEGIANHYGDADPDDGCGERDKELKAYPQTQAKAANVFLTELVSQCATRSACSSLRYSF